MRVLLLSPYGTSLADTLRRNGDQVVSGGIYNDTLEWPNVDFIVMFGHRQIIREPILGKYTNRIINIHGSYLPWNRGAYPNLFSWVEDTPKGASIHYVDAGIDTGSIIVRDSVDFSEAPNTTLKSSYDVIRMTAERLFYRSWPHIRKGGVIGINQAVISHGSVHTQKEAEPIIAKLSRGWDTPVRELDDIRP